MPTRSSRRGGGRQQHNKRPPVRVPELTVYRNYHRSPLYGPPNGAQQLHSPNFRETSCCAVSAAFNFEGRQNPEPRRQIV
ncbi:hypothetical protein VTI28DRAFT_9946 [Corynascus sepedonium]